MSSAFDTVDREKLVRIVKGIFNPQDTKFVDFFFTKTELKVGANNYEKESNFSTNISIPQGDGLSPVMFTLYLETVLKKVRNKIREQNIFYAYDVDFLSKEGIFLIQVEKNLKKWNFHMNNGKTVVLTIIRNNNEWKSCKKLGMLLNQEKNVRREKPFRLQRWRS